MLVLLRLLLLASTTTTYRECLLANAAHENYSCPSCHFTPLYHVESYEALWAEHPDHDTTASGSAQDRAPVASTTTSNHRQEQDHALQYAPCRFRVLGHVGAVAAKSS
jgi:hypothetical protein